MQTGRLYRVRNASPANDGGIEGRMRTYLLAYDDVKRPMEKSFGIFDWRHSDLANT